MASIEVLQSDWLTDSVRPSAPKTDSSFLNYPLVELLFPMHRGDRKGHWTREPKTTSPPATNPPVNLIEVPNSCRRDAEKRSSRSRVATGDRSILHQLFTGKSIVRIGPQTRAESRSR